ncbi:hypothetical protein LCGC14_2748590, partial [marine sediment metagenome]
VYTVGGTRVKPAFQVFTEHVAQYTPEWASQICGLPAGEAQPVIESLVQQGEVVKIGQGEHYRLMITTGWKRLAEKAAAVVQDYHQRFPARSGMPRAELSSRLQLGTSSSAILQKLHILFGLSVQRSS